MELSSSFPLGGLRGLSSFYSLTSAGASKPFFFSSFGFNPKLYLNVMPIFRVSFMRLPFIF
jgi:hypothetical protein